MDHLNILDIIHSNNFFNFEMGLLSEGSPLSWEETKKHADHVRKHGIQQFINQYQKLKKREKDVLYWGDEVIML